MKKAVKMRYLLSLLVIIFAAFLAFATCSSPESISDDDDDTPSGGTSHIHQWGIWTIITPATCLIGGEETRECKLDSAHKETRKIPIDPDAHDWEQLNGIAPTCTATGSGTRNCKLCDKTETGLILPIDPHAHDYGEWTVTMPITSITEVTETKTCSYDYMHKETHIMGTLGSYLSSLPDNTAATAYNIKLNVNYLGEYDENESISKALENNPNKYIYLDLSGSTITSIGRFAFFYCTNLTSVTIPDSVTSIGDYAFPYRESYSLTAINVEDNNKVYSSIDGVLYNKNKTIIIKYPARKRGSSFIIPNSVISIGKLAFGSCTSLTSVIIPNSVTSIGELAFGSCYSLTSVTIPNSVTSIGYETFGTCVSLTAINVDASNTAYSSDNGVLFNKNKTILIKYPMGKTTYTMYTIPSSVTSIGDGAFFYCTSLTNITIPNSVTSIGNTAFQYCTSLTSVTIPDSVTSIGGHAFERCFSLASVTIGSGVTSIGYAAFDGCNRLTSVTFATGSNIPDANFESFAFPEGGIGVGGDTLKTAYSTGKAGTYTRTSSVEVWARQ